MAKTRKFVDPILVALNRLTIPGPVGFSQEVRIFRGLWDEDITIPQIRALGKGIIAEALRQTLTDEVYVEGVHITSKKDIGKYSIKLTKEAVESLMLATEECRYDDVASRIEYAIWYNRE